jgi:hypothetical protein
MRGGKRTRAEGEAGSHRNKQPKYQWSGPENVRYGIAYDLIGHKQYLIDKALCRKAKLCK